MAIQVVTGDGSRVPAILLANKCDLREESTVIDDYDHNDHHDHNDDRDFHDHDD